VAEAIAWEPVPNQIQQPRGEASVTTLHPARAGDKCGASGRFAI
jgi:hypothetical protein